MIKLGDKVFNFGEDVSFRMYNGNDRKWKLYIGKLYSSCEYDGTITLLMGEVNRESFDGLLTVKVDKCKDFNYVVEEDTP